MNDDAKTAIAKIIAQKNADKKSKPAVKKKDVIKKPSIDKSIESLQIQNLMELIDIKKIEKRKSEMRLGLSNKSTQQAILQKTVILIQVPPVSAQEPVITKPVTPYELSHKQLNRLLKE